METTIAAISTAMSASGIGIVRISGENAMDVISRIYRSKGGKKKIKEVPSHTIHYGYIYNGEELVDEVLVMIMRAPRTFTGEDTVEIDCHGGSICDEKGTGNSIKKRCGDRRTRRIYQEGISQRAPGSFPSRGRYGRNTGEE